MYLRKSLEKIEYFDNSLTFLELVQMISYIQLDKKDRNRLNKYLIILEK